MTDAWVLGATSVYIRAVCVVVDQSWWESSTALHRPSSHTAPHCSDRRPGRRAVIVGYETGEIPSHPAHCSLCWRYVCTMAVPNSRFYYSAE